MLHLDRAGLSDTDMKELAGLDLQALSVGAIGLTSKGLAHRRRRHAQALPSTGAPGAGLERRTVTLLMDINYALWGYGS